MRAFTLIELLLVMAVVAILTAILLPVLSLVRDQARTTATVSRMEDIQRGLATLTGPGGAALALQRDAGLEGFTALDFVAADQSWRIAGGSWLNFPSDSLVYSGSTVQRPPDAIRHLLPTPWGARPLDFSRPDDANDGKLPPLPRRIDDLSLAACDRLLVLSGAATDAASLADPAAGRPWNDRWGRPLAVAYGLYQPPENDTGVNVRNAQGYREPDLFLRRAQRAYQTVRAVYVAVASAGRIAAPEAADRAGQVREVWARAMETSAAADRWWTEVSWANPPWTGTALLRASVGGRPLTGILTAPIDIR